MQRYTTEPIDPVPLKRGRGRPQTLTTAVWRGRELVAAFKSYDTARAFAARLNKLMRQTA